MTFEEQYKLLNKEQKKAVDTIDGPLLVIAGPGSGKTQILSMRVGKILKESQILASNILCLTFTESASVNMRIRLASLIGGEAYRTAIHTFHNFCVEIIQKYPEYFYSGAFFSPADELTQIQILQEIFDKLPQRNPLRSEHPEQGFVFLRDSLKIIGYLKKAGILPEEFRKIIKNNQKILPEINSILEKAFIDRLSNGSIDKISKAVEEISLLSEKYKTGCVSNPQGEVDEVLDTQHRGCLFGIGMVHQPFKTQRVSSTSQLNCRGIQTSLSNKKIKNKIQTDQITS